MRQLTRAAALAAFGSLATGCSAVSAMRHIGSACVDAPAPSSRHDTGPIIEGLIPVLGRPRTPVHYALALPRGHQPRTIERVVYALPGRGGSAHGLVTSTGYAAAMQEIVRDGGAPFAVLAMDAGESYFHPRASGEDRLAILERELPSLARDLLAPTLTHEGIVGISMGGYGALLAAERSPGRYRAVAVGGPALFGSYAEERHAIGDGFDDAAQFAQYDVIGHAARLRGTPLMVRAGKDDPFLPTIKTFARRVPHADVAYVEHGCHDDGFWHLTAHELLAFAAAH